MIPAIADYLHHLQSRHLSRSRLSHSRRTLDRLLAFLLTRADVRDWTDVTPAHLHAFADFLAQEYRTDRGQPVTPATRRQWLSCVRCFFTWLARTRRRLDNPALTLRLPATSDVLPLVPPPSAIFRLLDQPDLSTPTGVRDRALMELLYATGLRIGEAHHLDLLDVDLRQHLVLVRSGKGRRDRQLPLTHTAADWLAAYLSHSRPVLAAAHRTFHAPRRPYPLPPPTVALWLTITGRRLATSTMWQWITRYARRIDLDLSPHTLRHACATHLLQGGADVRDVQRLLGHACLDDTQRYLSLTLHDLQAVVNTHHPLPADTGRE